MLATWIVFFFCLICLLILIIAIAISHSFRVDLSSQSSRIDTPSFSIQGVTILTLIIIFLVGIWQTSESLKNTPLPWVDITSENQKKVIKNFFEELNIGINSSNDIEASISFNKMWNLFTPEYQKKYQKEKRKKFPNYKFPENLKELYKGTDTIKILQIRKLKENNDRGDPYFVLYRVYESHVENFLHSYFSQKNRKNFSQLKNFLKEFEDQMINRIENYYNLEKASDNQNITKEKLIENIKEYIKKNPSNEIINHRFFTQISKSLNIPLRNYSSVIGIPVHKEYYFQNYETYESVIIRIKRNNNSWKIDGINLISTYAREI